MTKGNLVAALAAALDAQTGVDLSEEEATAVLSRFFEIAGTDPCFVKAADDEPLFVLRAKDRVAPATVRDWAQRARHRGAPDEKWSGAMDCALRMEEWASVHGSKDPD